MVITLDIHLPALGIDRRFFLSPFEAFIPATSIYKNNTLCSLLNFNHTEALYDYEDEYLIIYQTYKPSINTEVFIKIKEVLLSKSEIALFYVSWHININKTYLPIKNASVCFKVVFTNFEFAYEGCLITRQHYIDTIYLCNERYLCEHLKFLGCQEAMVEELTPEIILKVLNFLFKRIPNENENSRFLKLRQ
jgi:hypothetical protein